MKVFLRPTVLSNWALTPKSTECVQRNFFKKKDERKWEITLHSFRTKTFKHSTYQVWPQHSLLAAHSGPWCLCGWLYGHGDETVPAHGQRKQKWCVRIGSTLTVDCFWRVQQWLLTLRISLQIYAIQSSFRELPFVFFTKSVTDPAPQNSITSYE